MTELATHTKGLEVAGFAGVELCGVENRLLHAGRHENSSRVLCDTPSAEVPVTPKSTRAQREYPHGAQTASDILVAVQKSDVIH